MGASRAIDGNSQRAYRVKLVQEGYTRYYGPYSTFGAAKGQRTSLLRYWGSKNATVTVEGTREGWEEVAV